MFQALPVCVPVLSKEGAPRKTGFQVLPPTCLLPTLVWNPDDSSSVDGYTYLTYSFNGKNDPTAFGTVANVSDASASLVYVFKDNKLIEVRWQYGKLDASAYDSIIADASSQFGPATYSREYSNGYKESWWRTKDVLISFLYQDSGISIYYKTFN